MQKQLVLDEKSYNEVMNYLQELPFKMSNNLIVTLNKEWITQNPEQPQQEIVDDTSDR